MHFRLDKVSKLLKVSWDDPTVPPVCHEFHVAYNVTTLKRPRLIQVTTQETSLTVNYFKGHVLEVGCTFYKATSY